MVFGRVVEFSGDRDGSLFLQRSIQSATEEERQRLFDEIFPEHALNLMQDVFGNYVSSHYSGSCSSISSLNVVAGVGGPEAFRAWVA